MENYLYVTLEKEANSVDEVYWWPLVFEAMQQASMQFQRPADAMRRGIYFSMEQMEQIECTFQELWKNIYSKKEQALISFWPLSGGDEAFYVQTSLYKKEKNLWHLANTLAGGAFTTDNPEENTKRLIILLRASLALYMMCMPTTLSMYWEEWDMPLLYVSEQEQLASLTPVQYTDRVLQWKKIASVNGQHIFILDPFPLRPSKQTLQFVSLPTLNNDDFGMNFGRG